MSSYIAPLPPPPQFLGFQLFTFYSGPSMLLCLFVFKFLCAAFWIVSIARSLNSLNFSLAVSNLLLIASGMYFIFVSRSSI